MTTDELTRLIELAGKVTGNGRWYQPIEAYPGAGDKIHVLAAGNRCEAAYIAAANPDTIRSLAEEVLRLRERPEFEEDVRRFHVALDVPAPVSLTALPPDRQKLRYDLIAEELGEFRDAMLAGDMLEQIDALCDILYVTFGAAVELGVDLTPFWHEVQRVNMTKIGGPIREDGKRMKPDGWMPPNHAPILAALASLPSPDEPKL